MKKTNMKKITHGSRNSKYHEATCYVVRTCLCQKQAQLVKKMSMSWELISQMAWSKINTWYKSKKWHQPCALWHQPSKTRNSVFFPSCQHNVRVKKRRKRAEDEAYVGWPPYGLAPCGLAPIWRARAAGLRGGTVLFLLLLFWAVNRQNIQAR